MGVGVSKEWSKRSSNEQREQGIQKICDEDSSTLRILDKGDNRALLKEGNAESRMGCDNGQNKDDKGGLFGEDSNQGKRITKNIKGGMAVLTDTEDGFTNENSQF